MGMLITTAMWNEYVEVNNAVFAVTGLKGNSMNIMGIPVTFHGNLIVAKTGVGVINSVKNIKALLSVFTGNDMVLNVGFAAGSVDKKVGTVLIVRNSCWEGYTKDMDSVPTELQVLNSKIELYYNDEMFDLLKGLGYSVEWSDLNMTAGQFVTKENINSVDVERNAGSYDMELFGICEIAGSVPVLSLKVVSDIPASTEVSQHFETFRQEVEKNKGHNFDFLSDVLKYLDDEIRKGKAYRLTKLP